MKKIISLCCFVFCALFAYTKQTPTHTKKANKNDRLHVDTLGCPQMWACNYNPEATEDDGSCEYESCKNVQIQWIASEYLCDTTVIQITIEDVTPENSVVYIYDNMDQENLLIAVIEGGTYYLQFTAENDTLYENLAVFILVYPFEEEVYYELNPPISFEVFTSPEQPIVVDNGNGMLECTNCDQDVVDLAWILNWDDSPQEDVIQDTALITVPGNFSGTVKVCLGNTDCYSCSEEFQFVEIEEKSYTPNLQIFSNGERPILIPNENGTLFVYDSLGRILYVAKVSKDEIVGINLASGIYEVVFHNEHYRIIYN